jgi:multiple sugar transport system permease protein
MLLQRARRRMTRRAIPYALILPSFLLTAFIIVWPLGEIVRLALHDVNRFGVIRAFSGLANFHHLFADADFFAALLRTLEWTAAVVAGTLVVSLPIALILNEDFYGRGLARILVMLPWSVSLTMTAVVWRWALNGESGMLNSGLRDLGVLDHNIQWLAQAATAFPVQILIGVLVSIPFTVTIFLGGLSSVPLDLYDAAAIEGAGPLAQFRFITLPLLRPFINIAFVLNTIYVFNSFPIIWATTQGGPANSTDILVTYLYKLAFRVGRLGEAAAVSLIMFAILLVFTLIYVRLAMREEAA